MVRLSLTVVAVALIALSYSAHYATALATAPGAAIGDDAQVFSIESFGAKSGDDSTETAASNTLAIAQAWVAANASSAASGNGAIVLVPANKTFYMFTVNLDVIVNVAFTINGTLMAHDNLTYWNQVIRDFDAVLHVTNAQGLTINGFGDFNGQGFLWWDYTIVSGIDHRPHLILIEKSQSILIHQAHFLNSPQFHLNLHNCRDIVVRDAVIHVDVEAQKSLLAFHGHLKDGLPTFPLNTDGIDPSAVNVLIENVNITNFDDAVAVKPCNQGDGPLCTCSSNMVVRNCFITYSVGMSIGSVPPNTNVNCIRNITIENITFENPIKAIYIKTNPGDEGTGIVDGVTYRNIHAKNSLWYPIWIGPQQQDQPGKNQSHTGCSFLYPIELTCPTQPRVTVTNIALYDVVLSGGVTLPGVILCDSANPCTNFIFQNVTNTGVFEVQPDYVCQNVYGTHSNTSPDPGCF